MYVCMYVCMYVRMYVCMYVCMYVYRHIDIYIYIYMYVYGTFELVTTRGTIGNCSDRETTHVRLQPKLP